MLIILIVIFFIVFLLCCGFLLVYKCFVQSDYINGQIYKCVRLNTHAWTYHIKYCVQNKYYSKKIYDISSTQQRHVGDYINIRYLKFCPQIIMRHQTFQIIKTYKNPVIIATILSFIILCLFIYLPI